MSSVKTLYLKGRNLIPEERKNKQLTLIMVMVAASLDNFNISGSMISYFSVSEKFDASSTTVSWVLSAYSLTLGAFIIITGKLVDVFGADNLFIIGTLFTSLFSLICAAIEKSVIALIIFRALQGISAATLIPSAFAFIGSVYSGKQLQYAVSVMTLALTAVMGVGLVVGGAFSESEVGYKGVFYLTFAMSFVLSLGLYFLSPPVPRTAEHDKLKASNIDYLGAFFLVIGLLLIILGLTEGGSSWKRPRAYVPIPVGFVTIVLVIIYEMVYIQGFKDKFHQDNSSSSPSENEQKESSIVDWRVRQELLFPKEMTTINNFFPFLAGTALVYITFISALAIMVQYYQYVELQTPIITGVKTLPMAIGLCFGALIYRDDVANRIGAKYCMIFSAVLQLTMSVWLSRFDFRVKNSYWKYEFISQFLFGYATNLYFQVYWNALLNDIPTHLTGVVSGIMQTTGQIGICLGNSIITSIVGELKVTEDLEYRVQLRKKFQNAFILGFASSAVFLISMVLVKEKKKVDSNEPTPAGDVASKSESV